MPSTAPPPPHPEADEPPRALPRRRAVAILLASYAATFGALLALGHGPVVAGAVALLPALAALGALALSEPRRRAAGPLARRPGVVLREDLLQLVTGFMAPLVLLDRREIVLAASDGARALLPTLGIGRPLSLVLREPAFMEQLRRVGRGEAGLQVTLRETVPVDRTLRVRFAPFVPGGGEPMILALFEDLSEQQALERMRVDFVANASHELRTPLASLLGFVETLQGPARNDAAARERFLGIMREQAQRMARLIEDLLSLSRAEMRAHLAPAQKVDLAMIAREIADSMTLSARERGVQLEVEVPDGPAPVLGDRDDLLRMTENLVENAIKYGASGQRVRLVVERAQRGEGGRSETGLWGWQLAVQDFGPGIAAVHLPRLTERFYRVDVSHSREVGGTGLGLAIVKHVVARHRARLEIESQPGAGARFSVLFPPAE